MIGCDIIKTNLKTCLKKLDKPLLIITFILFIIGALNIVNASSFEVNAGGELYYYFKRHILFLIIGFIAFIFIIKNLDLRIIKNKYMCFIAFLFIFLAVFYCFFQDAERGAQNWIQLGIFSFQPSEFSKPIIIIYLSYLFSKWEKYIKNNIEVNWIKELIKFIIIGGLIPIMVIKQNDLGSASIIAVISFVMFFKSKFPSIYKKIIANLLAVIVVVFSVLVITKSDIIPSYQLKRFQGVFTPCDNYQGSGYQVCNAIIALNSGGVKGLGIGKSKQKYSYIPEPHTDSVFAIIGEELGFFIGSFLILLIFLVIFRIYKLSNTINDKFSKYVCLGISWYLFIHVVLNLGGLMALIPLTGVPLPFFSYGGSYTLCLIFSLSIVQRICIEDKLKPIKINNIERR